MGCAFLFRPQHNENFDFAPRRRDGGNKTAENQQEKAIEDIEYNLSCAKTLF